MLGVDPGMTTGIFLLRYPGRSSALQCDADSAAPLIAWLIASCPGGVTCCGEQFIAGRGPGARGPEAGTARRLITVLDEMQVTWRWRAAGLVKPWATNRRLAAGGLLAICKGMPHAADAARHALYCAVHDCGLGDPLSRKRPSGSGQEQE